MIGKAPADDPIAQDLERAWNEGKTLSEYAITNSWGGIVFKVAYDIKDTATQKAIKGELEKHKTQLTTVVDKFTQKEFGTRGALTLSENKLESLEVELARLEEEYSQTNQLLTKHTQSLKDTDPKKYDSITTMQRLCWVVKSVSQQFTPAKTHITDITMKLKQIKGMLAKKPTSSALLKMVKQLQDILDKPEGPITFLSKLQDHNILKILAPKTDPLKFTLMNGSDGDEMKESLDQLPIESDSA